MESIAHQIVNVREGIKIKGHKGSWYVIDSTVKEGKMLYLLESEQYGDEAPCLIVDKDGNIVLEDVYNGFSDLYEL